VRKESFVLNLVRLNENNFLQTLRNKLSWGLTRQAQLIIRLPSGGFMIIAIP
jgi:hypothetical protein